MIYIIQESYGYSYEDSFTTFIGYTDTEIAANVVKEKLISRYELYEEYKDTINSKGEELYSMLPDTCSTEQYEERYTKPMEEFLLSLIGVTNTDSYGYSYYYVEVIAVTKC